MGGSEAKILLIGLDNSGKTTILSRLIDPARLDPNITPTIGFKKQKFSRNGISFQVLDMSGESKYRDLWKSNASNTSQEDKISGIIFVIDSTNKMRINVARSELEIILENECIPKDLPYLFFANKTDSKEAIPVQQVREVMRLKELDRNYRLFPCSGLTGQGIEIAIEWFSEEVKKLLEKVH